MATFILNFSMASNDGSFDRRLFFMFAADWVVKYDVNVSEPTLFASKCRTRALGKVLLGFTKSPLCVLENQKRKERQL